MGWIKNAKSSLVRTDAERAITEGRTVFVCRFDPGMTSKHNASGSLASVAKMIEAVEDAGWRMDRFVESPQHSFTGLFRRAGTAT